MTDKAPRPEGALSNIPIYTVSEISGAVKRALAGEVGLVRIRGEISGFKRHASGHLYFRLKDEQAVLEAVCWRGTPARLSPKPEDGVDRGVIGPLTPHPGRPARTPRTATANPPAPPRPRGPHADAPPAAGAAASRARRLPPRPRRPRSRAGITRVSLKTRRSPRRRMSGRSRT